MKIGFIDFSKDERSKVLATLGLLGEQNAIDELGIGTIRDAFADILFPGISTLQTRAKYFVLVPYLFTLASSQKLNNGREFFRWIQEKEGKLVTSLVSNSGNEESGIIGSTALKQKRAVKNKPSSIYWNGLRTFEILKKPKLSLTAACNIQHSRSKNKSETKSSLIKDGESFDDNSAGHGQGVVFSPLNADYNVEKEISIALTKKEAEYLKYKISVATMSKDSLLAFMIKNNINANSFEDIPVSVLPQTIGKDYQLAKDFAEFIVGAHIRYNIIYSEYKDEDMEEKFTTWKEKFLKYSFDLEAVLTRAVANYEVSTFCRRFLNAVQNDDNKAMDDLIIAREKAVKGSRSKLCKPSEYRYNKDRPIHNFKLNFRYGTAKTIIDDILKGLEG